MKRNDKTEMLEKRQAILYGWTRVQSASPAQLLQHGPYLPPRMAADFVTRYARGGSSRCRDSWALARIGLRRRKRVV